MNHIKYGPYHFWDENFVHRRLQAVRMMPVNFNGSDATADGSLDMDDLILFRIIPRKSPFKVDIKLRY